MATRPVSWSVQFRECKSPASSPNAPLATCPGSLSALALIPTLAHRQVALGDNGPSSFHRCTDESVRSDQLPGLIPTTTNHDCAIPQLALRHRHPPRQFAPSTTMMRVGSPTPSTFEVVSLPSSSSTLRPLTPRSALAATYSTYVVRVHTRHGIKTISFDVLAAFFTYTAKKAAEDLGISSRTLIRVCRSLGIRRWPYLGFRSEKNVERIRQEAIENLRRKLERESSEAASSPSASSSSSGHHSASASCLRGASAKRLLQVKLPSQAAVPTARGFERPSVFSHPHGPTSGHFAPMAVDHHTQMQQSLLTPPPSHHAFDLERRPSVSPHGASASFHKHPHWHRTSSPSASSTSSSVSSPLSAVSTASSMPSLSVLLEASILTAFKHEVESHLAQPEAAATESLHGRTMSMRDILNTAA
jgi:hypothetical protein